MTFRILARSNIKDSMTFLMAEPPLLRPDQQRQGDPAHRNVPARICTASEGIKVTRVHHGFPRAGAFGGGTHLGIPYPQMAERRAGGSGHLDGFRRRRGEVLRPDPGALLASRGPDDRVHTLCAQTSGLSTRAASQRRRQPIKSAGTNKGGVDSKAAFLRLSQAAVHSRAADSGCSIQADFQDGEDPSMRRLALASALLLAISLWLMPRALGLTRHAGQPPA